MACFFSNNGDHQHHWRSIISREPPGLCDQCLARTLESVERMIDRGFGLYHLQGAAGLCPDETSLHGLHCTWMLFFPPTVCWACLCICCLQPCLSLRQQQSPRHVDLLTVVVSKHVMIESSLFPQAVIHMAPLLSNMLRGLLFTARCKWRKTHNSETAALIPGSHIWHCSEALKTLLR